MELLLPWSWPLLPWSWPLLPWSRPQQHFSSLLYICAWLCLQTWMCMVHWPLHDVLDVAPISSVHQPLGHGVQPLLPSVLYVPEIHTETTEKSYFRWAASAVLWSKLITCSRLPDLLVSCFFMQGCKHVVAPFAAAIMPRQDIYRYNSWSPARESYLSFFAIASWSA
jgi:hypothetical protein